MKIEREEGFYWIRQTPGPSPKYDVQVAFWEVDSVVEDGGRWLIAGDDGCAHGDDGIVAVLSERLLPPKTPVQLAAIDARLRESYVNGSWDNIEPTEEDL